MDTSQTNDRAGSPADSAFSLPLSIPLVLDVDGTLIAGDLLYKSFVSALRLDVLVVLPCMMWLLRGRAALKRELALRCHIDWDRLKLHQDVVALAIRERKAGRSVVIATAADRILAVQLASRLGFVDQVIASGRRRNLKGMAKAQSLTRRFPNGFIYAGDSRADLSVWQRARAAVLVNTSKSVSAAARAFGHPILELAGTAN